MPVFTPIVAPRITGTSREILLDNPKRILFGIIQKRALAAVCSEQTLLLVIRGFATGISNNHPLVPLISSPLVLFTLLG